MTLIAMENHHSFKGKPSINGPCPMAMLNNQRVLPCYDLFVCMVDISSIVYTPL